MSDESVFRFILICIYLVLIPIALYHRVRSEMTFEKLDRSKEGLFILLTLRPLAFLKFVALVAFMINPDYMEWSTIEIPNVLRWIGVVLLLLSSALLILTFISLGPNLTDTVVPRRDHTLVTSGPYKWVRHPFYIAFFGAVVADSLIATNWFIALTGGLCCVTIFLRTAVEEEQLVNRFGEKYLKYSRTTGKFLPFQAIRGYNTEA